MQLEYFTCSEEDFDGYLQEFQENWNVSALCSASKRKKEFGGHATIYEYAHFLGYEVERLAKEFSLDPKKATGFFYYLVSAIPQYGEEGMNVIKEYLEAKGERYDRIDILAQAALVDLDDCGGFLFNPIQEVIHDLFDVEQESQFKEIEFAKTFHFAVKLIKKAELLGQKEEIEKYAVKLISDNYMKIGSRECIVLLKEKEASLLVDEPAFDEVTKNAYFRAIAAYMEGSISDYPIASFIIHCTEIG